MFRMFRKSEKRGRWFLGCFAWDLSERERESKQRKIRCVSERKRRVRDAVRDRIEI